jgi:hypothetical protein
MNVIRENNHHQKLDKIQNKKGIREIILKRNNLGENFMVNLSNCLRYDRFLKVIDVSGNFISESSLRHFLKHSLQENNTLISFVANKNPGINDKFKKKIALCLLKNIENIRNQGIDIKPEWIRKENLMFKIPKRIMDTIGIMQNAKNKKAVIVDY